MKKSKATKIAKMLSNGNSVAVIKRMLGVSESYIYAVKKQMAAAAATAEEAEVENDDAVVRPRLVGPHKAMRVTKAEAEAIKAKAGEYIVVEGAKSVQEIDAILNERASTYGAFKYVAEIAQEIKDIVRVADTNRDELLAFDQREALDMIASKIGRILGGDANYVDSWVDIAGYAKLVSDRLEGKVR